MGSPNNQLAKSVEKFSARNLQMLSNILQFYQVVCKCYTGVQKMPGSIRVKLCEICSQPAPVLYRVKHEDGGNWVFVCPQCWTNISRNNQFYVYGGTWKAKKNRK